MTLVYARRSGSRVYVLSDTGSEAFGMANHPISNPIFKIRLWHQRTFLALAGNVELAKKAISITGAGKTPDQLAAELAAFQAPLGVEAPEFLLGTLDGARLWRIRDGAYERIDVGYIGSRQAFERFSELRQNPADENVAMLTIVHHPDGQEDPQFGADFAAFRLLLEEGRSGAAGVAIAFSAQPKLATFVTYLAFKRPALQQQELDERRQGDGWCTVPNNDEWNGGSVMTVVGLGPFGVGYHLEGAPCGHFWHSAVPPDGRWKIEAGAAYQFLQRVSDFVRVQFTIPVPEPGGEMRGRMTEFVPSLARDPEASWLAMMKSCFERAVD